MGSRRVGHTGRKLARRWVREIQNAAVATTVSLAYNGRFGGNLALGGDSVVARAITPTEAQNGPTGQNEALYERFYPEFVHLVKSGGLVEIRIGAGEAWCLLAAIQLACRHPNFKGATRRITEQAARRLQDALLPKGSALAEVAERGWHEEYDVAWPERARGK